MKEKIIIAVLVVLTVIGGVYYSKKETKIPVQVKEEQNSDILKFNTGNIVGSAESKTAGKYLTDPKGMTLYVFADDKRLESACDNECIKKWPIYEFDNKNIPGSADELSRRMNTAKRADGWQQYAYNLSPVYYYIGDKKPGDRNGVTAENLGSKWSIIILQN